MSRLATATLAAGFLATSLSANSLAQSNSRRVDLPPAANEIAESQCPYETDGQPTEYEAQAGTPISGVRRLTV